MEADRARAVIASLLAVFSGKQPLALLDRLVAPNLVCYMDRVRLNLKRDGLRTWFRYLHATMRRRGVAVDVDIGGIEEVGGRHHVRGTVTARHANGRVDAGRFAVAYRIEQGRVAGVWSTRTNYVGVVGESILFPMYLGYLYHCLRAWGNRVRSASGDGSQRGRLPRSRRQPDRA